MASNLALSGLASGVDTSSIVSQLMALERQATTRLGYRQNAVEAQRTALKDVAAKLSALQSAAEALAGATIQQVADAINAKPAGAVVAAVVKNTAGEDRLVLSARRTGSDSDFTVSGAGVLTADAAYTTPDVTKLNAAYALDGVAQPPSQSNVLENAVPGLRITLKGVTAAPATVTVGAPDLDRDAVKAKVKAFVTAYNAVVDTTRAKLTAIVQAAGINDLGDLGVTVPKATGGVTSDDAKAGRLVLDEAKLTAALEADWTAVKGFFEGFADDVAAYVKTQTGGSGVIDSRLKGSERTASRIQEQIDATNLRLDAKEQRLKAQFAAMELALQNSQTQQAWLTGQLAALN